MKLFGRKLNGSTDILQGFKIETIEITEQAFLSKGEEKYQGTLVPSNNNDQVQGTLLELTNEELLLADKYEPGNNKGSKCPCSLEKKHGYSSLIWSDHFLIIN